jgi:anaerobic magnesium-protoporphyrin IX monomethyl ester cyclase
MQHRVAHWIFIKELNSRIYLMDKAPMTAKQIGELDVLFILPPHFRLVGESFFNFPLGLGYLVSYLQKKHFVSAIFNMDTTKRKNLFAKIINRLNPCNKYHWYGYANKWDVFYKRIEDINDPIWAEVEVVMRKTKPKIVGITASIVSVPCVFNIAKIIKKTDSNVRVVLGGPAATTIPDYILGNEHVDYLVYGEGEETVVDLIEHISNNDTSLESLKKVKGIIFKHGGEIVKAPARSLIPDINELPFPDRESMFALDENNQIRKVYSNGDILASRGCPYLCKFCACYTIWGTRTPRTRSVGNIMQEVEHIVTTYGQESFIFWDDLFTTNKKRVIEFCEEILKRDLNIKWICMARLNTLDRESLDIMKKAGCVQIQVGIESGSERMLKFIGKNLALSVINEKTQIIKDAAMNWLAFFIIGFPTETKEEIKQTLNYIEKIKPSAVGISIFSPYPGTDFFTYLNENKLFSKQGEYLKNDTWYTENNYTGTMPDDEFSKIALEALKFGDKYNRKLSPTIICRLYRLVQRIGSKVACMISAK